MPHLPTSLKNIDLHFLLAKKYKIYSLYLYKVYIYIYIYIYIYLYKVYIFLLSIFNKTCKFPFAKLGFASDNIVTYSFLFGSSLYHN